METGPNILILETETGHGALVLEELRKRRFPLGTVNVKPLEQLPQALKAHPPDLIVVDFVRLTAESFSLFENLRDSHPDIPVIVITSNCDPGELVELFECGAANHVRRHQIADLGPIIQFTLENPDDLLRVPAEEVVREIVPARPFGLHPRRSCSSESVRRVCERCDRIADVSGKWERLSVYLRLHQEATVALGVCPKCARENATLSSTLRR